MNYVVYHKNCLDGFTCAWLMRHVDPSFVFIPINAGQNECPPELKSVVGADIYVLDVSGPWMQDLCLYNRVTWCDHHATAEKWLDGMMDVAHVYFNKDKCGATLTCEMLGITPSKWVQLIEDRDLWRWKLPETRPFTAGLKLYPFDLSIWDTLHVDTVIAEGKVLCRYFEKRVAAAVYDWWLVGGSVRLRGCYCSDPALISDIAGAAATEHFPGMTFYYDGPVAQYSLRGPGARTIAEHFGGGGHDLAAGFRTSHPQYLGPIETC